MQQSCRLCNNQKQSTNAHSVFNTFLFVFGGGCSLLHWIYSIRLETKKRPHGQHKIVRSRLEKKASVIQTYSIPETMQSFIRQKIHTQKKTKTKISTVHIFPHITQTHPHADYSSQDCDKYVFPFFVLFVVVVEDVRYAILCWLNLFKI